MDVKLPKEFKERAPEEIILFPVPLIPMPFIPLTSMSPAVEETVIFCSNVDPPVEFNNMEPAFNVGASPIILRLLDEVILIRPKAVRSLLCNVATPDESIVKLSLAALKVALFTNNVPVPEFNAIVLASRLVEVVPSILIPNAEVKLISPVAVLASKSESNNVIVAPEVMFKLPLVALRFALVRETGPEVEFNSIDLDCISEAGVFIIILPVELIAILPEAAAMSVFTSEVEPDTPVEYIFKLPVVAIKSALLTDTVPTLEFNIAEDTFNIELPLITRLLAEYIFIAPEVTVALLIVVAPAVLAISRAPAVLIPTLLNVSEPLVAFNKMLLPVITLKVSDIFIPLPEVIFNIPVFANSSDEDKVVNPLAFNLIPVASIPEPLVILKAPKLVILADPTALNIVLLSVDNP